MLQGPALSPVQAFAAELLLVLDAREDAQRKVWDLRSRIAGAHPDKISEVFPEWFPKKPEDGEEEKPKADNEYEWRIPESQNEVDDIDAWVREHHRMTITSDEMKEWQ